MHNETVARRYATAIFGLAKERNAVAEVARDLHRALDAIRGDDTARRFFLSPVIDRAEKAKALEAAFAGLDPIALHATLLLVRKRREALLEPIVAQVDKMILADQGRRPLEVTSARRLAQPELDQLVTRLSRLYNTTFEVHHRVDPALLGGVRIGMPDRAIDASVAGRLDEFARELTARK